MTKTEFITKARELGFTDHFILEVLALRQREREQGIMRPYIDYLPGVEKEKQGK